uniref:Glycerol-3-phosphate dehydrogenase (NAD(+)) n=1 Tax=viral metagenome TaxID=1070528 RepID=A0A6C0AGG2_9ZZZZ|tara:strand:+ start:1310 stop:2305 length:996 start_codon:yes stop_codon:yes gene_type:complete
MFQNKVSILGSGGFGSSIALVVASQVEELCIWCRRLEIANEINTKKTNNSYIKSKFPSNVKAYTNINIAINKSNIIIIAIPGNFLEEILKKIDLNNKIVISLVKSVFVDQTGEIVTTCELIEKYFQTNVICLSGPNLYSSLDNKDLSEATIGVNDLETGNLVKKLFNNDFFKTQITLDRCGVELCGILKNIIAIGVGFLGNKPNSVALLIRKGLNEMYKLSLKLRNNVSKHTFYESSCGIGDLYLTCVFGRGKILAKHYSESNIIDSSNWEKLEETILCGMKIPDHHNVKIIGKLIEKNCWTYEFPIFYNIYKISWTNDSEKSLIYLKRNL